MRYSTFRVEGGLGKHIVFSALIPELYKKYGQINIISAYYDVFLNNKMVKNSWGIDYFSRNARTLQSQVKEMFTHEPYKGDYMFGDIHVLESWCTAYGIDRSKVGNPNIFINEELKAQAKEIVKQLGGKFFLTQFSGGQPPIGFNPDSAYQFNPFQLTRNYPFQMATILVNKLSKQFPDYKFLDFTLPNEPTIYGTERIVAPYLVYYELCKYATGIICIDSSLAHFSAAAGTKAHVLWNTKAEGKPTTFGWESNLNISAPDIAIDYDIILEILTKETK